MKKETDWEDIAYRIARMVLEYNKLPDTWTMTADIKKVIEENIVEPKKKKL